jgi:hypothetical protein
VNIRARAATNDVPEGERDYFGPRRAMAGHAEVAFSAAAPKRRALHEAQFAGDPGKPWPEPLVSLLESRLVPSVAAAEALWDLDAVRDGALDEFLYRASAVSRFFVDEGNS